MKLKRATVALSVASLAAGATVYLFTPDTADAVSPAVSTAKAKTKLPACKTEDSTAKPCVWIGNKHGNGRGLSFRVDAKGKRHYRTPDNTMALKKCANEDGPGACYWFADKMGNGVGHSFWIDSMACFHYLRAADDKRWGDHHMPCDDPYEMDKTSQERECQDAAAEGDESRMNARFAECHRKYGQQAKKRWKRLKKAEGWKSWGTYDGHKDCYALIGDTTVIDCFDGFTTTS